MGQKTHPFGFRVGITVALIPTTLRLTTLSAATAGGRVNLEADMFAKTIVNYLRNYTTHGEAGVTLSTLRAAGFVS